MGPRRLLDSFSIADSRPLWSYLHTGTLLRLISFICHSYANTRGVGVFFPFWNALRGHTEKNSLFIQVLSFHTLAHSFARTKTQLFYFQALPHSLRKNTRGWGIPSTPRGAKCKPGDASGLLVDVVLRFQALQQWLQKWFVRIGRSADRLRHFLSGRREITLVRRDPRQRQVAGPVVRILFGNQGKQLKRSLGISLPLEDAGIEVELGGRGLIERRGKRLGRFLFLPHGVEDSRFRLPVLKAILILNRGLFPLQRFFQVVIVVQAPLRRLVVTRPTKAAAASQFILDALQHHRFPAHQHSESNPHLLPAQSGSRPIRFDFLEGVSQRLAEIRPLRLGYHAPPVFFPVLAETSPPTRILRAKNPPLTLFRHPLP